MRKSLLEANQCAIVQTYKYSLAGGSHAVKDRHTIKVDLTQLPAVFCRYNPDVCPVLAFQRFKTLFWIVIEQAFRGSSCANQEGR